MKIMSLMFLPLSFSLFATEPDFTCVSSKTGIKYEVFYSYFTEIDMTKPNGESESQDSMSVSLKFYGNSPAKTVYTFTHEEGDVVAKVTKIGHKTTFKGFNDTASCK